MKRLLSALMIAILLPLGGFVSAEEGYSSSDLASLKQKEAELDRIKEDINTYETEIYSLQDDIRSLSSHVFMLENSIEITKLTIASVKLSIEKKEIELKNHFKKMESFEVAKKEQQRVLAEFMSLLIKQDQLYFSKREKLSSDASLFFGKQSFSDLITRKKYLDTLKDTGTKILSEMVDVTRILTLEKEKLQEEEAELELLRDTLKEEEVLLDQQRQSKEILLAETKGKEENYQLLLTEKVREHEQVDAEVTELYKNLTALTSSFSASKGTQQLSKEEIEHRLNILEKLGVSSSGTLGLNWPMIPTKGLSATFMDPSYKSYFGVHHKAIDIPAPMRTPTASAADGYVTKTADNGLGYSYIVVAHAGGIMTLYGHMNEIMVSTGDYVARGQTIGLSGGQPGTRGAGWMTTGPHLHFEVFQDGKHVNPLPFLDQSVLQ